MLNPQDSLDELSREIGWVLKHGTQQRGVELNSDGFAAVSSLVDALHSMKRIHANREEVIKAVVRKSLRSDDLHAFPTTATNVRRIHELTNALIQGTLLVFLLLSAFMSLRTLFYKGRYLSSYSYLFYHALKLHWRLPRG